MKQTVFNSSALPSHLDDSARFSLWYDTYSTTTLRSADVYRLPDRPFSANWQLLQSDAVTVDRFDSTLQRFSRRAAKQPVERFCFAFNAGASRLKVAQRGRELVGGKNNAGFFCMAEATDIAVEADGLSWIGMSLPRKDLLERVPNADDLVLEPLDPANSALRYLQGYLGLVAGVNVMTGEPELVRHAGAALLDLRRCLAFGQLQLGDSQAALSQTQVTLQLHQIVHSLPWQHEVTRALHKPPGDASTHLLTQ